MSEVEISSNGTVYRVNFADNKLIANDEAAVELTDQYSEILQHLIESPGRLISVESLREKVWNKTVQADAVKLAVRRLRALLNANRADFIRTVRKKGFRFIGTVREIPSIERKAGREIPKRTWQWRKSAMGHWRDRINKAMAGRACVSDALLHEVDLKCLGPYRWSESYNRIEIQRKIKKISDDKGGPGSELNQYHAVLACADIQEDRTNLLEYYLSDYATLKAIERQQPKTPTLYCGAIFCCSEAQKVYLHKRSMKVDKYKGWLHSNSGNFMPETDGHRFGRPDRSIADAARRELIEETNASIFVSAEKFPLVFIHEMETDRRIVSYLGVDISKEDSENVHGDDEGEPIAVEFDELAKHLEEPKFVSSGVINYLAWLALGAFTWGPGPGFDSAVGYHQLEQWLVRHNA